MSAAIAVVSALIADSAEHVSTVVVMLTEWQFFAAYTAKLVVHGVILPTAPREAPQGTASLSSAPSGELDRGARRVTVCEGECGRKLQR